MFTKYTIHALTGHCLQTNGLNDRWLYKLNFLILSYFDHQSYQKICQHNGITMAQFACKSNCCCWNKSVFISICDHFYFIVCHSFVILPENTDNRQSLLKHTVEMTHPIQW